jgi:hypothetical protein
MHWSLPASFWRGASHGPLDIPSRTRGLYAVRSADAFGLRRVPVNLDLLVDFFLMGQYGSLARAVRSESCASAFPTCERGAWAGAEACHGGARSGGGGVFQAGRRRPGPGRASQKTVSPSLRTGEALRGTCFI